MGYVFCHKQHFKMFSSLMKTVLPHLLKYNVNNSLKRLFIPQIFSSNVFLKHQKSTFHQQEVVENSHFTNEKFTEIVSNVNNQIVKNQYGRLFAVVQVCGKQFKITDGDIIIIEGYWPPNIGDELKLEKVLLTGGADFTLIGQPLVQDGLVNVTATVIEKTLSHTKTHFKKRKRKQFMRINFYRVPYTMLRINNIELTGELNKPNEGFDGKIF